jgi:hypothetical protein
LDVGLVIELRLVVFPALDDDFAQYSPNIDSDYPPFAMDEALF